MLVFSKCTHATLASTCQFEEDSRVHLLVLKIFVKNHWCNKCIGMSDTFKKKKSVILKYFS